MRRVIIAAALVAAACQSTTDTSSAVDQRIAAARGPQVPQLCFTQNIEGWSPLRRDVVLVRTGIADWYELDLTGACDADWAGNTISTRTRVSGSSCLSAGDQIQTFDLAFPMSCGVRAIYEWDEKAAGGVAGG